jgi:hypothetical protein
LPGAAPHDYRPWLVIIASPTDRTRPLEPFKKSTRPVAALPNARYAVHAFTSAPGPGRQLADRRIDTAGDLVDRLTRCGEGNG